MVSTSPSRISQREGDKSPSDLPLTTPELMD